MQVNAGCPAGIGLPDERQVDPEVLASACDEIRALRPANVWLVERHAHISDPALSRAALAVAAGWIASGVLPQLWPKFTSCIRSQPQGNDMLMI